MLTDLSLFYTTLAQRRLGVCGGAHKAFETFTSWYKLLASYSKVTPKQMVLSGRYVVSIMSLKLISINTYMAICKFVVI